MKNTSNYNKVTTSLITAALVALPPLTLCSSSSPPLQLHCSGSTSCQGQNKAWIHDLSLGQRSQDCEKLLPQVPKWNSDPQGAPAKAAAREIPGRSEPHLNLHLPVPSSLRWISTLEQVGAGRYSATLPEPVLSICWESYLCHDQAVRTWKVTLIYFIPTFSN